ncbi:MAG: hypothetical protein HWE10_06830 [Gammaproteobacteria bacterium]|nr:hypothetical protein [Gammaproteobacteria bacterium]
MKVLLLCLIIISVLLPETGQLMLSGQHQHTSSSMMTANDTSDDSVMNCHNGKKQTQQMMNHDCCDDNAEESLHQCGKNCDECSDCLSSGLAILAHDLVLQSFHHIDIVRTNPQLPTSPIQSQVIPPIG